MIKHKYSMHSNHVSGGSPNAFSTRFTFLFTVCIFLYAFFWFWYYNSNCQSMIHKCQRMSFTIPIILGFVLLFTSMSIVALYLMTSSRELISCLLVFIPNTSKNKVFKPLKKLGTNWSVIYSSCIQIYSISSNCFISPYYI